MSIIYDYLKQIRYKKEPVLDLSQEKAKSFPVTRRKIILAVLVIGVCLGVAFAVYVFMPRVVAPIGKFYHPPVEDVSFEVPMMRSAEPAYMLEGIIYNPFRPFAIINGKMLEVGAQIGGSEIAKITSDSVVLNDLKAGTSQTLHL